MITSWENLDGKFRQVRETLLTRQYQNNLRLHQILKHPPENPFQDALARKDYVKAKRILD